MIKADLSQGRHVRNPASAVGVVNVRISLLPFIMKRSGSCERIAVHRRRVDKHTTSLRSHSASPSQQPTTVAAAAAASDGIKRALHTIKCQHDERDRTTILRTNSPAPSRTRQIDGAVHLATTAGPNEWPEGWTPSRTHHVPERIRKHRLGR